MTKRIASFLLAAVMLIGVMILPATAASTPFKDVREGKWYTKPIKYVYDNKLMNGMTDTIFEPDSPMTRSMLVTVLWRVEGAPKPGGKTPFTDLKAKWYMDAVAWAYENSIVKGTSEKTFSPNTSITREQIATIFFRYAEFAGRDTSAKADLTAFPDGAKVAKYAKAAMSWAVGEGLITGTKVGDKNYLDPKGNATRAQVATILERYLEAAPKSFSERIDRKINDLLCYNHDDLNFQFGPGVTLTEEALNGVMSDVFGCKVEMDSGMFDELKETYQGQDNLWHCYVDDCPVTFTDETTGETYTVNLGITLRKELYAYYTGAVESGALTWCPDDRPDAISDALSAIEEYEGGTLPLTKDTMNVAYVESFFREVTGLTDKNTYKFFTTGFENKTVTVCFRYDDPVSGRTYTVGAKVNVDVSLADEIEARIADLLCYEHDDINLEFGYASTFTEESLNACLGDVFGYKAEIIDGFDELKEKYGGSENHGGPWVDVEVLFTDEATGEEYVAAFMITLRKDFYANDVGALVGGVLTWCPDDRPDFIAEADRLMDSWDGDLEVFLHADNATIEALEVKLRSMTGLEDPELFEFYSSGFDPTEESSVVIVLFKYYSEEEGRTYTVSAKVTVYNSGSSTYLPH